MIAICIIMSPAMRALDHSFFGFFKTNPDFELSMNQRKRTFRLVVVANHGRQTVKPTASSTNYNQLKWLQRTFRRIFAWHWIAKVMNISLRIKWHSWSTLIEREKEMQKTAFHLSVQRTRLWWWRLLLKPFLHSVIFILSRKDAMLVGKPQNISCWIVIVVACQNSKWTIFLFRVFLLCENDS